MTHGWLTPSSPIPAGYYCARVRVPNDTPWRSALNGALQELVEFWNWQEFGNLPPDVTVDILKPLIYDAQNSGDWCMLGAVWPYASATPPSHTLACDGANYARADYPNLYAALDAAFIIDADTFEVPNLNNRFVFGADLGSGSFPVGTVGGEQDVTLDITQVPTHTHTDLGHTHAEESSTLSTAAPPVPPAIVPSAIPGLGITGIGNASLDSSGGGGSHTNMPPYLALKWCIVFE